MASATNNSAASSLTFCIGVDATGGGAFNAFQRTFQLLGSKNKINVLHIYNKEREAEIPRDFRVHAIESFYSNKLTGCLPTSRWKVVTQPKKSSSQLTHQAVCEYANHTRNKVDILVVGFYGRKGAKPDATMIGSTTDLSMRKAFVPTLIVKSNHSPDDKRGKLSFVVAIDGTSLSQESLNLVRKLAGPEDTIVLVHVVDLTAQNVIKREFRASTIREKFQSLPETDPRMTYSEVELSGGTLVADKVVQFASEHSADILVIGAGQKAEFGSTAVRIVRTSACDVLVYQRKGEFLNNV